MKHTITFLLFLSYIVGFSQKYAVIDHAWKKKIVFTDSVVKGSYPGSFVMYAKDLDTLVSIVEKFRNIKDSGLHRITFTSSDYSTENIETTVVNVTKTYGDSYDITVTVSTDKTKASFKLCESRIVLPQNEQKIRAFYSYLKNGKKAWGGYLM